MTAVFLEWTFILCTLFYQWLLYFQVNIYIMYAVLPMTAVFPSEHLYYVHCSTNDCCISGVNIYIMYTVLPMTADCFKSFTTLEQKHYSAENSTPYAFLTALFFNFRLIVPCYNVSRLLQLFFLVFHLLVHLLIFYNVSRLLWLFVHLLVHLLILFSILLKYDSISFMVTLLSWF